MARKVDPDGLVSSAYREYREHVARVLRRCGVPAADVDDLTQEVFLVLLRRIDEQRDPGAMRGWLFQAARRVASNYRRATERERRRLAKLGEPAGERGLEDEVARSEATKFIARFVGELDESSQRLFVLSELEGRAGREIAQALDLKTKTAYSRIYALRRRFDRDAAREFGSRPAARAWLSVSALGAVLRRTTLAKVGLGVTILLVLLGVGWALRPTPAPAPPAAPPGPSWDPGEEAELREALEADAAALRGTTAALAGRVIDPDGAGIAGAWVCSWRQALEFSRTIGQPTCVRSEADGGYRLPEVLPGRIRLTAGADGFLPGEIQGAKTGLAVEAGDRTGLNIVLHPGGTKLSGIVEDLTGGPVEGARVVLRAGPGTYGADMLTFGAWGDRAPTVVETGPDGRFTVSAQPGLSYWQTTAPGYAASRGEVTAPTQHMVVRLAPGGAVAGTVVDAKTGAPVADARVVAFADTRSLTDAAGAVYTDAQGRFRIEHLPPGRYKPSATTPGRLGLAETSVNLGIGETREDLKIPMRPVPIVAGMVTISDDGRACPHAVVGLMEEKLGRHEWQHADAEGRIVFPALLPGRYRPIVYCEGYRAAPIYPPIDAGRRPATDLSWPVMPGPGIRGAVLTEDGPASRATVLIERRDAMPPFTRGIPTDAEGRFELRGLEPGVYELSAGNSSASTGAPTEATVGESDVEVQLRLEGAGSIRGTVVDAKGEPVGAAIVRARAANAPRTVRTADDGSIAFEGLPWRRYDVSASVDGSPARVQPIEVGAADPDVEIELEIDAGVGSIEGRVVDESGLGVPDALVGPTQGYATGGLVRGVAMTAATVLTDAEGRFRLEHLPARRHEIVAVRPEGGSASIDAEAAAEPTPVKIVLPAPASASGTITAPGIDLPATFFVQATGPDRPPVIEMFSDPGGAWSLDGLAPGPVKISAITTAGRASADLELKPGGDRSGVQLELQSRIDLEASIVDIEGGAPLADWTCVAVAYEDGLEELGAKAEVAFSMKPPDPRQRSDADGKFVVPAQSPGPVHFAAFPKGFPESEHGAIRTVIVLPLEQPLQLIAPRPRFSDRNDIGHSGIELRRGDYDQDWTIQSIAPDGPAAELDLRPEDEIVAADGHPVTGTFKYLLPMILNADPGTSVELTVARGVSVKVTLAKKPN